MVNLGSMSVTLRFLLILAVVLLAALLLSTVTTSRGPSEQPETVPPYPVVHRGNRSTARVASLLRPGQRGRIHGEMALRVGLGIRLGSLRLTRPPQG